MEGTAEEKLLKAISEREEIEEELLDDECWEDEEDEIPDAPGLPWGIMQKLERTRRRNKPVTDRFLGKGRKSDAVALLPLYYGKLLAWALNRHIANDEWQIAKTLGYSMPTPRYIDVNTGNPESKLEHLLASGQLLIKKGELRMVITVEISDRYLSRSSVHLSGLASQEQQVTEFAQSVKRISKEENFYRGKRLEFCGDLDIINVRSRSWDSVILDEALKAEIRANAVGFLHKKEYWPHYGIPLKRGILLSGEPGTGKTAICKALMAEAEGITCIAANAYGLEENYYVSTLYEIAEDLSPTIVFIEDIDLIAQNRMEFGHHQPPLISLLAVLDGIAEHHEIITVATTNSLETLDKALSQRPSRFDRVIEIPRPSLQNRRQLVSSLCQKIPLDEAVQTYIARKTENCTPAQLQEVIYSLAIEHVTRSGKATPSNMSFNTEDIDRSIAKINGRNGQCIGFNLPHKSNGKSLVSSKSCN